MQYNVPFKYFNSKKKVIEFHTNPVKDLSLMSVWPGISFKLHEIHSTSNGSVIESSYDNGT